MQVQRPIPTPSRRYKMNNPEASTSTSHLHPNAPSFASLFKIVPCPPHGLGAVAIAPIGTGQLIHVEQPLVVQDDERSAQSILSSLCRHPTTVTKAYFNLHNAFGDSIDPIIGIFNSNCIPLAPVEPIPNPPGSILLHGVFLHLSRFNTSCTPNASVTWNERQSRITVHALQPIQAGEEIRISYGQPLFSVRDERREFLRQSMGFVCECSCCSLPRKDSEASDERRAELKRLFKAVPYLAHDAYTGIRAATQAVQTLQTEGLANLYTDSFSYDAYQFCMSTNDTYHAMQWLERAYKCRVIASGSDSDGASFFAQIISQLP